MTFPALLIALAGLWGATAPEPTPVAPAPSSIDLVAAADGVGPGEEGATPGAALDEDRTESMVAPGFEGLPEARPSARLAMDPPESAPLAPDVPVPADTVTLDASKTRGLAPAFLRRLSRVAERMALEHDVRVEVVEGVRSEARQQELYAQGRTTPGPVVTWTTNSLHLDGVAADLRLDGQPPTGEGALLLARVAREEGLRTLYPFDSGHIQLDDAGDRRPEARLPLPEVPARGAVAAPPPGVAVPAPVARPAVPARPGASTVALPVPEGGTVPLADVPVVSPREAPTSETGGNAAVAVAPSSGRDVPIAAAVTVVESSPGEVTTHRPAPKPDAPVEGDGPAPDLVHRSTLTAYAPPLPQGGVRTPGSDGVEGVWRPAPIPDASEPGPSTFQRIHVPIEVGSESGSIRLGLRGGLLHAELRLPDAGLVDRLARSVQELRRGLAERGVEAATLAVRVAPSPDGLRPSAESAPSRQGDPGLSDGSPDSESGRRSTRDPADERHRPSRNPRAPKQEKGT